jgi:xylosylprotein 4-beta-galactosyltransferase
MLLNVGYVLTNTTCDYLVMHDVDLLPLNDDIKYFYPSDGPFHISSPQLHPLYHYEKYVGGILMLTREHYRKINGMTNMFWGWGREDDEFYLRMKEAGLKIHRPAGITTGYKTFKHNHDKKERKRDMKSYGTQNQLSRKRDKRTGLSTLKYTLVSVTNITINHSPLTLANVELHCDYEITPFCDHPSNI